MSPVNWDDIDLSGVGIPYKELTLQEYRNLFLQEWKLPENPWLYETKREEVEIFPCERLGKMKFKDYPEWLQKCMKLKDYDYNSVFRTRNNLTRWYFGSNGGPLLLTDNYFLVRYPNNEINVLTSVEVMQRYKKVLP